MKNKSCSSEKNYNGEAYPHHFIDFFCPKIRYRYLYYACRYGDTSGEKYAFEFKSNKKQNNWHELEQHLHIKAPYQMSNVKCQKYIQTSFTP
jgi:hypothetical protein